jgi:hypothetical protein
MNRIILALAVLAISFAAGCTFVNSGAGGNTAKANDAWFVDNVGLGMLTFAVHVYYCPPMGSGGAAQCTEAEMVENAQPAAGGGTTAPTPPPPTNPPPPPAGGGGGEPAPGGGE